MARWTHYKRVPVGGMLLGILMLVGFALKPAGLSLVEVAVLLAIGGTGLGVMYPVTTTIVQNVVEPHQLGVATGALNFFRLLGGAIIVAAFGAIIVSGAGAGGAGADARGAVRRAAFGRRCRRAVPLCVRRRRGVPGARACRGAGDRGAAAARP